MKTFMMKAVSVFAVCLAGSLAHAQDAVDLDKAKAEGKVVWYTSTPIDQANQIVQAFKQKTGINVELFRSGGSAVLRRFMQEQEAKVIAADVLTTSDPAASNVMASQGILVPFKPVNFDKIPETAKDPDGAWIGQRINVITIYLRSDKVAEADRPKSWSDLTDAKYKGQLVMTDPSFASLQLSVVAMNAKNLGWDYFEKLAKNDVMVVQGNQQVSDNIKRGERLIAVGALDSYAAQDRMSGHEITTVYPSDGTYAIPSPTAIIKGSPNPEAAKAFAEFMLSDEAQKIFPKDGGYSARIDIPPPEGSPAVSDLKLLPVDYAAIEKEATDVKERFNDIFR